MTAGLILLQSSLKIPEMALNLLSPLAYAPLYALCFLEGTYLVVISVYYRSAIFVQNNTHCLQKRSKKKYVKIVGNVV